MSGEGVTEWIIAAYFVIGFGFAVRTWWENGRTYYVMGDPPSGLLAGMFWPIIALAWLIYWTVEWRNSRKAAGDRS